MVSSEEGAPYDPDLKKEDKSFEKPDEPSPGTEELQKKYDDLNDRYLRLAADFENYKKRAARDLDARAGTAVQEFAVELLEVIDNFERAISSDESSAKEGLLQIHKLFRTVLERYGIRPIEAKGKKFNPAEHEAVAVIPSESEEGTIIDELCCGYCMKDKVIRYAKVAVSKGKENE
jgi:molecular chaperone GrpE